MDKLRITKTLETIRAVKSKYFNKGIYENSGNVRETWKVINSMLGRNTTTTLISECSLKAVKINQLGRNWPRTFQVSDGEYISCGVPQRSILDPLLFLVCVNNLRNCLQHFAPGMLQMIYMYISINGWSTSATEPKLKSDVEEMNQ